MHTTAASQPRHSAADYAALHAHAVAMSKQIMQSRAMANDPECSEADRSYHIGFAARCENVVRDIATLCAS